MKFRGKGPTCSDQHQVGHGGPVELIVGDEGDIPAGGDSGLVRESQEQAVVVVDEVDVLDVAGEVRLDVVQTEKCIERRQTGGEITRLTHKNFSCSFSPGLSGREREGERRRVTRTAVSMLDSIIC